MTRLVWWVAVATLSATQAFAQAKKFEGLSLGVNADAARTSSERVTSGAPSSDTANATDADFQVQYAWGLGHQFVMGVGATLGASSLKAGTVGATEYVLKDRYSVDFLPGLAVSDSTLVYAKLAYLTARSTETSAGVESANVINGYGYGLGVRALMDKSWYVQAAYDINKYDEKRTSPTVTLKSDSYLFSLGVGYKF